MEEGNKEGRIKKEISRGGETENRHENIHIEHCEKGCLN